MAIDVSVIVVTWNVADLIGDCLGRLERQTRHAAQEIIVVDNGSTDGTLDIIRAQFPTVTLLVNRTNVGFAAANNQAVPHCRGRYILLQNPDALAVDDAVDRMVAYMDAHPAVGALGPRLLNADGGLQRSTAGAFPSLTSAAGYFFLLDRLPAADARFRSVFLNRELTTPTAVDWISGASLLLRADLLRQVGLLDETYFMYMEDVDLCHRIKQAGWAVIYDPTCAVIHYVGHNTKHRQRRVSPHSIRNFNAYFRRRHGLPATLVLKGMEAMGFGGRMVAYWLAARVTRNPDLAGQAHLHWQYLKLSCELRA